MKNERFTIVLVLASLLVTVASFCIGCANIRSALFEPRPSSQQTNGPVVLLQPRTVITDALQTVGGLAGPQAMAGASLVVAGLGLVASLLNRAALKRHTADASSVAVAPVGLGNPKPPA